LVYSLANRNGKVEVNPARLVRLRKENNAVVRFLEAEEEEKLRRVLRESDRYLEAEFDLALNTAMRRGEQYRLRWEDVNCRLEIITIPRSKHGERRYIPINSAAKIAWRSFNGRLMEADMWSPGQRLLATNTHGERSRQQ
jgi:integrase